MSIYNQTTKKQRKQALRNVLRGVGSPEDEALVSAMNEASQSTSSVHSIWDLPMARGMYEADMRDLNR